MSERNTLGDAVAKAQARFGGIYAMPGALGRVCRDLLRSALDQAEDAERAWCRLRTVMPAVDANMERVRAALPPDDRQGRRTAAMLYLGDRMLAGHTLDAALSHLAAGTPGLRADHVLRLPDPEREGA